MIAHVAAFAILWFALALLLAPFIGERLKRNAAMDPRELEPDPPDYQPDEDSLYADARAEMDQWHEEGTDGHA